MDRILTKSGKGERIVWGVCGGIAEYFRIDPTIVRLVWVFITLTYGVGLLAYIIAAIVIPEKGGIRHARAYTGPEAATSGRGDYSGMRPDVRPDIQPDTKEQNTDDSINDWKTVPEKPKYDSEKSRMIIGIILIAGGALFLLKQLFDWVDFKYIVPAIIILIGGIIIYAGIKKSE